MKKKYAFLLMGIGFDMKNHQAVFETKTKTSYIFTVNTYEDGKSKLLELYKDGFGAVDVCGAFTEENVDELIKMTNNKIIVSRVTNRDSQNHLIKEFYSKN